MNVTDEIENALIHSPVLHRARRRVVELEERNAALERQLDEYRETQNALDASFFAETGPDSDDVMVAPEGGHNYDGYFQGEWDSGTVKITGGQIVAGVAAKSFPNCAPPDEALCTDTFAAADLSVGDNYICLSMTWGTQGTLFGNGEAYTSLTNLASATNATFLIGIATKTGSEITGWEQRWQGFPIYAPKFKIPVPGGDVFTSWYIHNSGDW